MDAFYASVEQRDKPSLRGKPVVVGGTGQRGVVATASYQARVFGVRSAMPSHEARRRCPHAAFLAGRFDVYRETSRRVMEVLRDLSPLVEPISLDEAFVDLRSASPPATWDRAGLTDLVRGLKAAVAAATGGLTASVGVGTSKFVAKVASELGKPDGLTIVDPGTETDLLRPLPAAVIPGVGPVTAERLRRIGVATVADLQATPLAELVQVVGRAHGQALVDLAAARDDRPVEPERDAKSISVEDTFETDLVDPAVLQGVIERHARQVASRLSAARLFARTVTVKARRHDFVTHTRARTLRAATDRVELITAVAQSLLRDVDASGGLRLLGVGVAGLTELAQEDLFGDDLAALSGPQPALETAEADTSQVEVPVDAPRSWSPGADVVHAAFGPGWVWGSGLGRVTVRFETRDSPPGPIRTFAVDDPDLRRG